MCGLGWHFESAVDRGPQRDGEAVVRLGAALMWGGENIAELQIVMLNVSDQSIGY